MTFLLRFVFPRQFLLACLLLLLAFVHPAFSQTPPPKPTIAATLAATPNATTIPTLAATPAQPNATPATTAEPKTAAPAAPVVLDRSGTLAQKGQSLLGLCVFLLICFGVGQLRNRTLKPQLRTVVWGIALQFAFAILVLHTPGFFYAMNAGVDALLGYAREGSYFLFNNLVDNNVPVGVPTGSATMGPILKPTAYANTGAYFAFTVLPTIIFFSALSTLMYFLGVLQPVVKGLSWVMQRSMGTSGSETLSATANIFLGQTEAPLFVRPFIAGATKSELMAIMTGGFSNIASGVLAAYVSMLVGYEPQIAGHLLAASIISAPASLVVAKLLHPESEPSATSASSELHIEKTDANAIDSAARGALEGLELALNVGAMLIVFIALVAMINALLGWIGHFVGIPTLSLQFIFGYIFSPVAWLLGVPWESCSKVGSLLGVKTAINEFVAYLQLSASMGADRHFLDPRSFLLAAYALCGFANFSSVAIQIGGIGAMAPERRHDLSRMGLLAMFGGAVASCMTACVVGILL